MSIVRVDPAILGGDDDGELTAWLVPDGVHVEADQPIAEVTAAKVVTEVTAPEAGTLRQLVAEGAPLVPDQEIAVVEATAG
jgi:pyruvate/2-oxoglutarate dehydrogenase complex dihydrolipoamide acyltransferase (E2) component